MYIQEGWPKPFIAAYGAAIASSGVGGKNSNRFRIGAAIVHKKSILMVRHNSYKTHPLLVKYFKWPYCHAEAYAIVSLGLDNCFNKTLYVVRVYRNNEIALAKPCSGCLDIAKFVGIKNIYYTTVEGYQVLWV
jgi:tRNA(Arg) A34 adenosine deaminase TadA